MKFHVDPSSLAKTQFALEQLPVRVQFRQQRIALNAMGGEVKREMVARASRDSGLLKKSIMVAKPIIPNASRNKAHHGRPASIKIGPRRATIGAVGITGKRKRSLKVLRTAGQFATAARIQVRRPTRYAHLVEKGHRIVRGGVTVGHTRARPFVGPAAQVARNRGMAAYTRKLSEGVATEAQKLFQSLT
jgi:hypothetical protein